MIDVSCHVCFIYNHLGIHVISYLATELSTNLYISFEFVFFGMGLCLRTDASAASHRLSVSHCHLFLCFPHLVPSLGHSKTHLIPMCLDSFHSFFAICAFIPF